MAIYNAIMAFTGWMWTLPMLIVLIGGGLVITVACDFVQIKHFGHMLKTTFGDAAHNKDESGISSWSAMVATLANTIGTGNIIGVGSAIALGGPGAVFWMWVIGFIAMALKYAEALLGVYTRQKDENGQWRGGANIYLAKIWKPLGWIWAVSCCFGNWLRRTYRSHYIIRCYVWRPTNDYNHYLLRDYYCSSPGRIRCPGKGNR